MIRSRRLRQTEEDKPLFDAIEEWRKAYPQWLRDIDAENGELEQMWDMAAAPDCVCIGIWDDLQFKAILAFRHAGSGWFEAHLEGARGFDRKALEKVAWEWGWRLFETCGAQVIYSWVADVHKMSAGAANYLCLTYDGSIRWKGMFRGRVLKWKRYALYRSTWSQWLRFDNEQQGQNGNEARRSGSVSAESVSAG